MCKFRKQSQMSSNTCGVIFKGPHISMDHNLQSIFMNLFAANNYITTMDNNLWSIFVHLVEEKNRYIIKDQKL